MKTYTLEELASFISGDIHFSKKITITGLNDLKNANQNEITFIGSRKFIKFWDNSKAAAVIVSDSIKIKSNDRPLIYVKDADIAMAILLDVFSPKHAKTKHKKLSRRGSKENKHTNTRRNPPPQVTAVCHACHPRIARTRRNEPPTTGAT